MAELTPMMQQYFEIKNKNKDYILFYRLGDFYEMFFDDAKLVVPRAGADADRPRLRSWENVRRCAACRITARKAYIARLVQKGYKVAICEQMKIPKRQKVWSTREIIRRVTPGTVDGSLHAG